MKSLKDAKKWIGRGVVSVKLAPPFGPLDMLVKVTAAEKNADPELGDQVEFSSQEYGEEGVRFWIPKKAVHSIKKWKRRQ